MIARKFAFDDEDDAPPKDSPSMYLPNDMPDDDEYGEPEARADLYNTTTRNAEYHAMVYAVDGGFVVNYSYGAIGSTLRPGTKTPTPVDRKAALRLFDSLVAEKLAKGYVPRASTGIVVPVAASPTGLKRGDDTIDVALLEPVDDPEPYLAWKNWWAQQKYDGKRMLLRVSNGSVSAQNRKGQGIACPPEYTLALRLLGAAQQEIVIDGEAVGPTFYAFDLLRLNGQDIRQEPYGRRLLKLEALLPRNTAPQVIQVSRTARTEKEKRQLYKDMKAASAEGIVFKKAESPYKAGRDGTRMVKHKFWASNTVMVLARNDTGTVFGNPGATYSKIVDKKKLRSGKRSIQMAMLNKPGGTWVNVGDMSIPVNWAVPEPGTLVEVRYLYAFPKTNVLFQPQYEGPRDDVDFVDTLDKLQYKGD